MTACRTWCKRQSLRNSDHSYNSIYNGDTSSSNQELGKIDDTCAGENKNSKRE